ncbi:immunity protein Imm33 domain-containing protein [Cellulomonas xiejunii]|uniref:immunity protein Imm33 domain-containing protein n=1 Tax=Cellulomonas xiejunii TaxID=2968083 RepID=UPI003D68FF7D
MTISAAQLAVARRYGAPPRGVESGQTVGAARNLASGIQPVNGLRLPPALGTTGWFLWAGEELSEDPDFFVPLHVEHLVTWCALTVPYLALPPGWRFLIAPGHEDVWCDASLVGDSP